MFSKHWAPMLTSVLLLYPSLVGAQLTGRVGPTTTVAEKAAKKICSVADYGAKAGSNSDFGPALTAAWTACKSGGLVYVPPGTYQIATWAKLRGGTGVAIQWDGIIERSGTGGGTLVAVYDSTDFELFSGTSQGAIQGYGYEFISKGTYGPRLLRFVNVTDMSVHGLALIDSPAYYITCIPCVNAELYNIINRGIFIGATDGFDVAGNNIWVHDVRPKLLTLNEDIGIAVLNAAQVEVTNDDECVTTKSPGSNYLIESVHCNLSGGCAMGSLGLNTDISNIHYRNIYLVGSGGYYIKSNGGTGTVTNCTFENFITHRSAYTLTINTGWGRSLGGKGVEITNLSYRNWTGENTENSRPVMRFQCPSEEPCTGISVSDIDVWTSGGSYITYECENAFGSGGCLRPEPVSVYATSFLTVSTAPPYEAATMPNDHSTPFPSTEAFTIPPIPTTFFPSLQPFSSLLSWTGPANAQGGGAPPPANTPEPTTRKATGPATGKTTGPATGKATGPVLGKPTRTSTTIHNL